MAGEDVNMIDVEETIPVQQESQEENTVNEAGDNVTSDRIIKLPLTRIKTIMKSDPDVTLASQEAVIALAKATELFIQMFAKDASFSTMQGKRKTLQRKDLDQVMDRKDCYLFLDGTLDGTSFSFNDTENRTAMRPSAEDQNKCVETNTTCTTIVDNLVGYTDRLPGAREV